MNSHFKEASSSNSRGKWDYPFTFEEFCAYLPEDVANALRNPSREAYLEFRYTSHEKGKLFGDGSIYMLTGDRLSLWVGRTKYDHQEFLRQHRGCSLDGTDYDRLEITIDLKLTKEPVIDTFRTGHDRGPRVKNQNLTETLQFAQRISSGEYVNMMEVKNSYWMEYGDEKKRGQALIAHRINRVANGENPDEVLEDIKAMVAEMTPPDEGESWKFGTAPEWGPDN